jgi:ATP-binding cassette subfamily C protein CydCD
VVLKAPSADLILLDEPTAQLDERTAHRVLTGLRTAFEGKTIVHVTHRPDDARDADSVIQVEGGRVLDAVAVA